MTPQPAWVELHYHRPGKGTQTYRQRLVVDRPDLKVLATERYAGGPLEASGQRILEPGAAIWWFVFPGAWHDIGRFHLADGRLTGWYTNLCTPVTFRGPVWSTTDLFLDHWLPVAGTAEWLDEAEFEEAVGQGVIGVDEARRAREERDRIQAQVVAGAWPPSVTRVTPPAE